MAKGDRIQLRVDQGLKSKVRAYCARNQTTISDVVNRFFVRLLEEDERRRNQVRDAEQI
jgi:antitoxin component of RelBE/YafQ-DinJ toxin-antitoxin module